MTHEQLQALTEWIDARIDEKIEKAMGRDGLYEAIEARGLYRDLKEALGIKE